MANKGTMTYKDGSVYEGWFNEEQQEGFGVYYSLADEKYVGNWKEDK